eukprot:SAG11_NODE_35712_length_265_cov_0.885542_1_plen_73_part_10
MVAPARPTARLFTLCLTQPLFPNQIDHPGSQYRTGPARPGPQVIYSTKFRRCDCTPCTAVRQMTWTKFKYLVG